MAHIPRLRACPEELLKAPMKAVKKCALKHGPLVRMMRVSLDQLEAIEAWLAKQGMVPVAKKGLDCENTIFMGIVLVVKERG